MIEMLSAGIVCDTQDARDLMAAHSSLLIKLLPLRKQEYVEVGLCEPNLKGSVVR